MFNLSSFGVERTLDILKKYEFYERCINNLEDNVRAKPLSRKLQIPFNLTRIKKNGKVRSYD